MKVYCITNIKTGLKCVGSTVQYVSCRWAQHKYSARRNPKTTIPLRKALNEYGAENFEVSVLETVNGSMGDLRTREKFWITDLSTHLTGYNTTNNPYAGISTNKEHTAQLLSGISKSRWASEEFRQDQINKMTGIKRTYYKKNRNDSDELRERRRQACILRNKKGVVS